MEPLVIFFSSIVLVIILFFIGSFFKNLVILHFEIKKESEKRDKILSKQKWW